MLLKLGNGLPFWFLKEEDISFTMNDPGPKEIDIENLSTDGQTAINTAVWNRRLIRVDSYNDQEQSKAGNNKVETPVVADPRLEQLRIRAGTLIKGSAKSIINFCQRSKISDSKLLHLLLDLEQERKQKRKTVIKALEETIDKIGGVSIVVESKIDQEEVVITIE